ncbi:MAG: LuxR C-terminal-related transcriptional regulator [Phycisphaerales bacterium]|nr:LuxR C-terminal-related transcriptional regulator [Phycisphaerales bacterium]
MTTLQDFNGAKAFDGHGPASGEKPARATPIRASSEQGHGISDSAAILSHPHVKDVAERLTWVAGALAAEPLCSPQEWATIAAQQVLAFFGGPVNGGSGVIGGPVGAWVAVVKRFERNDSRRVDPLASVGYSGIAPDQVRDAAMSVAAHPSLWMDVTSLQGKLSTSPMGVDEAQRVTLPLGRFLRGVQPAIGTNAAVVWQVDGRVGAWGPTAIDAAAGELLSHTLAQLYVQTLARREQHWAKLSAMLSPSQAPILPLLATGMSQRAIADRLGRSLHTVHDHVKGIYAGLNIKSRYQLFVLWNGGDPASVSESDGD